MPVAARPIPLAIFLTSFEIGGTERQMIELIRGLDPRRFEVHVPCLHRRGPWLSRVIDCAASNPEFAIDGFARPSMVRQVIAFARWCRRQSIALVHTCELYTNIFGLVGARLAGVPVRVANRRGMNIERRPALRALQRGSYRIAHRIVANSRAAAACLAAEGVPAARTAVIPNGIDVSAFSPCERRTTPGSVLTVANLRREKGLEILIDAAARLRSRYPALQVLIAGDGALRSELERRAADRGVAAAVTFLGAREDVPALLASAEVFVLPSRTEAFPNAILEAMSAAVPVVATRVGGIPELVEHGRTGWLVPPENPDALADGIAQFLERPDRAAAFGRAGREVVEREYGFDRMVDSFQALYEHELARAARAVPDSRIPVPES